MKGHPRSKALSKGDFHALLARWVSRDEPTIGPVDSYGGKGWVFVTESTSLYHLNADSTRDGVRQYLAMLQEDPDPVWAVVPNTRARRNKVVFGSSRIAIPGFYLYLDDAPAPRSLAPKALPPSPTAPPAALSAKTPETERSSAALLCAELLQVRLKLLAEGTYSRSHDRHLRELASVALWKHSEANGKINGCRFWTTRALASRAKYGLRGANSREPAMALRHEHLVPRKQIIDELFSWETPTARRVRRCLDEKNIGVVVTADEHSRLPPEGNIDDPWQRYRIAGLEWEQLDSSPVRSTPSRATPSGRSRSIPSSARIRVLVDANPKRTGSAARRRFDLYEKGITVEEFLARGGKLVDVRWDLDHGFISLDK